jgi:hypothetical protein
VAKKDLVKVTLRVPKDIYEVISASCIRIKTIEGKEVRRVISLNDAFIDFLWRGIGTAEDDDDKAV